MQIISVANQKGGTAKTSTVFALVTGAAYRGKKALAIDLDPQGNLSFIMGADISKPGTYEILTDQIQDAAACVQHSKCGDIIPASLNLAGADIELSGKPGRDFFLQAAIEPLKAVYDLIVIDTPPTLGTLIINALTATDKVVIPMNADILSLQGLYQLNDTIKQVKRFCNHSLDVGGILISQYDSRTVLAKDLRATITSKAQELSMPVYKTVIRNGVAVQESQTMQESLFTYAPKSKPAQDYLHLLDEMQILPN